MQNRDPKSLGALRKKLRNLARREERIVDDNAVAMREFVLDGLEPARDIYKEYRVRAAYKRDPSDPGRWDIEDDIATFLPAFRQQPDYDLAAHDLKLIRRFLLNRAAFGLVRKVNAKLRDASFAGRAESWVWLLKDYLCLRIGLSMLLAYAALSGLWTDSLVAFAGRNPSGAVWAFVALATVTGLLLLLTMKDALGGPWPLVLGRAGCLLAYCAAWSVGGYYLHGWLYSLTTGAPFPRAAGALMAVSALLTGLLTQFFFTREKSITEPL